MIINPYTFNGTSLQSTDFETSIPRASALAQGQVQIGYVKRAGAEPVYAGKDFQPVTLNLEILCKHDFTTLFETINQVFDVHDETPRQFIVQDTEDSSAENPKQYYVYATTKQVQSGHDGNMAVVTLALDDPIWQSVTQNSQTFATTSSTDSTSVTANGNADSYPVFEITPTSQPSTDYLYNTYLQILPTSTDPWPNRFLDVVGTTDGTTWDTAALIAAGKMQSAGQDLRLFRDGVEVDCWFDGINTTDTHIITVVDMPGAHNMTLKTAIGSTDTVTEIVLNYTNANKAEIQALPNSGRLILDSSLGSTDSEEFTYTARNISSTKLSFTINIRSVRGTTASSFSANANVRYLPYDFNLIYGNASDSARVTDDTHKPIQDLTSRNNSFVYTNFADADGLRANIWKQNIKKVSNSSLSQSGFYTSTDDEGDTDPYTALGLKAETYQSLGVWKADTITLGWLNYFPDIVSSVSANGAQSQSSTNWVSPKLRAASNIASTSFTNLWTITAQSDTDVSTWTTWSKASSDATLPANTRYLQFYMVGSQLGTTDYYSKAEISSLTVGLTKNPNIMIRPESNNYKLSCTLKNETTGDSLNIIYPMLLNTTLYVDTDPDFPNAKYNGVIVNGAISLSSIRSTWLKLGAGANSIGYETNLSGASDISIAIKWRDRMNLL